jgi:hypothetical protein
MAGPFGDRDAMRQAGVARVTGGLAGRSGRQGTLGS